MYPSFRPLQDKFQSGQQFVVAVLGDYDFSAADSWVSQLRQILVNKNTGNQLVDYSTFGLTTAGVLGGSLLTTIANAIPPADICLITLGVSDFAVMADTTFGTNLGTIATTLQNAGIVPIFVQGNDVNVSGYGGQTSEYFCKYMRQMDSVGESLRMHSLNAYHKFRHIKELGGLATYVPDGSRMNTVGHSLLLSEVYEWFLQPQIFKWKADPDNFAVAKPPTPAEPTIISRPDGDCDYWYGDGVTLYYTKRTGTNWQNCNIGTICKWANGSNLTNIYFPALAKHPRTGWFYLLYTSSPWTGISTYTPAFFILKSPNGYDNWQFANDSSPVLTSSRGDATFVDWTIIWNGALYIEQKDIAANDIFHLLIDGARGLATQGVPAQDMTGMLYSSATEGGNLNFNANKVANFVKDWWTTPEFFYIAERQMMCCFYFDLSYSIDSPVNNSYNPPWNGFGTVRVGYCDVSAGFQAMAVSDNWKYSGALNIQEAGRHMADPTITAMPAGKDSKLCLVYNYNQMQGTDGGNWVCWSDLTAPMLYDAISAFPTLATALLPAISIDPVNTPVTSGVAIIGGSRASGATVTVSCATASVGVVTYPTATTWQVGLTNLSLGENIVTATVISQYGNGSASAIIVREVSLPNLVIKVLTDQGFRPCQVWEKTAIGFVRRAVYIEK